MKEKEKEFLQDDGQIRVFIVPVDILNIPDLTIHEKMVYVVLRSYVNPTDPTAFPSYQTIAEKSSMSRRHAMRCVNLLTEKGLILKKTRLTVTEDRKIRNTSNLYTIVTPKSHQGSDSQSPTLVTHSHQGSDSQSPYHKQLTKPNRNMIDCGKSQNDIFDFLQNRAKEKCYIHNNVKMTDEQIEQIYLMLTKQFRHQISKEVIDIATDIYFDRACEVKPPEGILMKLNLQNPIGFFQICYKDAIQVYKAKSKHTQAENLMP